MNMNRSEELREEALANGAEVVDWRFESDRIKGLYCDGVIAVSMRLGTTAEEAAVIAEELGHHLTASGNILDQTDVSNRKQEIKGRAWAYDRLIGLSGIARAIEAGCRNRYEAAEFLDVPEEVLQEAVDYYHEKYGLWVKYGDRIILFEKNPEME